jgi:serine/threonine-protein kinase HipA
VPDVELPVSLYGTHVGELTQIDGRALLRWSTDAEQRWGVNSPVLSHGLRVGLSSHDATESFFGGLLPEGVHIDTLAREAKCSSADLVGLLAHVGADLAGALRVGETGIATPPQMLDSAEINRLLTQASGFLVGGGGSALPGFQRKLTLTRRDGRWWRGNGTLPSTHILKPVAAEFRSAIESERFTLDIARAIGLLDFDAFVEIIGDREVLVIERYDRFHDGAAIERIHQEDAAQALGLPWGGNDKFEQNNPTANLRNVASLLDRDRTVFRPQRPDTEKLLRYTVLNVAAGNTDAHAKNFSLLHSDDGSTRLAPMYDAAPLALAFEANQTLAMWVNGVKQLPDVTRDDLVSEATAWGLSGDRALDIVNETLTAAIEATRTIDAHESIEAHIPGYIRGQARNLLAGQRARLTTALPPALMPRLGTPQPRST